MKPDPSFCLKQSQEDHPDLFTTRLHQPVLPDSRRSLSCQDFHHLAGDTPLETVLI